MYYQYYSAVCVLYCQVATLDYYYDDSLMNILIHLFIQYHGQFMESQSVALEAMLLLLIANFSLLIAWFCDGWFICNVINPNNMLQECIISGVHSDPSCETTVRRSVLVNTVFSSEWIPRLAWLTPRACKVSFVYEHTINLLLLILCLTSKL